MPFWKQKAPGLNLRNMRTSLRDFLFRFYDFMYCIYSCKMYVLVLKRELLHGHVISILAKNLDLYSLMGVWFVISLVMQAHNKFDKLKYFN